MVLDEKNKQSKKEINEKKQEIYALEESLK